MNKVRQSIDFSLPFSLTLSAFTFKGKPMKKYLLALALFLPMPAFAQSSTASLLGVYTTDNVPALTFGYTDQFGNFTGGSVLFRGSTSGTLTIKPNATAGTATLTFPTGTDTLTANAATQTLTNKTLTSPTITGPTISGGAVGASIISSQTTAPTTASCGNGPTPVTGTDVAGLIATGTGTPTTCDLVFATPKTTVPHCVGDVTSGVGVVTVLGSSTTAQVNFSLSATATGLQYICIQ